MLSVLALELWILIIGFISLFSGLIQSVAILLALIVFSEVLSTILTWCET